MGPTYLPSVHVPACNSRSTRHAVDNLDRVGARTIINPAHSLKINVIAKSVATEERSRLLRLLGCDEMQGYLFSKPLPRELLEARYLGRLSAAGAAS